MLIRPATISDVPVLIELTGEIQKLHADHRPDLFPYPQDAAALAQHFTDVLSHEANHVLLLEDGDEVIGHLFAEVRKLPPNPFKRATAYLYIHQIGVRDGQQRRGLGLKLLDAAIALAGAHQLDEIQLDYWSFNTPARAFYLKNGFRVFREVVTRPRILKDGQ